MSAPVSSMSRVTRQLLCSPNPDGTAVLRLLSGRLCGHCGMSTVTKPERKVRTRMKAWQIHKYGGRNTFRYENLPMQYTEVISAVKIENFIGTVGILLIFLIPVLMLKTLIVGTH